MTIDALGEEPSRSLLLVHGRGYKPSADVHKGLCMAAIRHGVERDFPDTLGAFDALVMRAAWYGDLNADILQADDRPYDESLDVGDRQNAFNSLRQISLRRNFGIRQYDQLPGKSALPEAMVDVMAPVLGAVGLSVPLIRTVSKDFARYFDRKSDYGKDVRRRLRVKLSAAMDRGERITLVSHGTGSVIAYDVLWELSHDPEFNERNGDKKVDNWVTLGSPLGDSSIRKRLLGSTEKAAARFPINVIAWHNVAAEDDYTCHDNTLADDFKAMLQKRLVSAVHDYKVFNLAVRYGKSNPHSSVGYYIHPRVSKIIADWLQSGDVPPMPKHSP